MKRIGIIFVAFYIALILFMPKVQLWYLFQNIVAKQGYVLITDHISEKIFVIKLKKNKLFKEKRGIADINEIEFLPLILFNRLKIRDFYYEDFLIKHMSLTYSLKHPFLCLIEAQGDFGILSGSFNIRSHKLSIDVKANKKFAKRLEKTKNFKKTKKGYHYESSDKTVIK